MCSKKVCILRVGKNQQSLKTKQSCVFLPQGTNLKADSISVVFFAFPSPSNLPVTTELPLWHTAVTFSPSVLQGLSHLIIFSLNNYSNCLASLSLEEKNFNKIKTRIKQQQAQQLIVPAISRIIQP